MPRRKRCNSSRNSAPASVVPEHTNRWPAQNVAIRPEIGSAGRAPLKTRIDVGQNRRNSYRNSSVVDFHNRPVTSYGGTVHVTNGAGLDSNVTMVGGQGGLSLSEEMV